jgi:HK97 family phage prohead protease
MSTLLLQERLEGLDKRREKGLIDGDEYRESRAFIVAEFHRERTAERDLRAAIRQLRVDVPTSKRATTTPRNRRAIKAMRAKLMLRCADAYPGDWVVRRGFKTKSASSGNVLVDAAAAADLVILAATWGGPPDRQGDVLAQGCVQNLDELVHDGWIAFAHSQKDMGIAYPTAAVQDDRGLMVYSKWHSTPAAREARTIVQERMAAGKTAGASVGWAPLESTQMTDEQGNPYVLRHKINAYEVSIVNLAANPRAMVLDA